VGCGGADGGEPRDDEALRMYAVPGGDELGCRHGERSKFARIEGGWLVEEKLLTQRLGKGRGP